MYERKEAHTSRFTLRTKIEETKAHRKITMTIELMREKV